MCYLTDLERTDTLTQVTVNTYASLNNCVIDNYYNFHLDATLTKRTGTLKCNVLEPQYENGIWSWRSNHSKITFNLPFSGLTNYDIITLNQTTFVVRNKEDEYIYQSTFNHSL